MELEILNKKYKCDRHKGYAIGEIEDRSLRKLFDLFKKLLPDHPDEKNTEVWFLERKDDDEVMLLWCCHHYECTSSLEISGLLHFLLELEWHMSPKSEVHLDFLDGFWEKLLITVYNAPFKFPEKAEDIKNLAVDYGD